MHFTIGCLAPFLFLVMHKLFVAKPIHSLTQLHPTMKTQNLACRIGALLTAFALAFVAPLAVIAQETKDLNVDVDIDKGGGGAGFFTQPWVWIVGVAVFILLLVALMRGRGGRGDV
jgi:hypothetical protein